MLSFIFRLKYVNLAGSTILASLMEKLESVQYSAALAVTEHGGAHRERSCTQSLVGSR